MEYTQNYQLPLWDKEDAVLRTDFNENNQKIDAALEALANEMPKVFAGSYVGDGTSDRVIQLPFAPKFAIMLGMVNSNYRIVILTPEDNFFINGTLRNQNLPHNTKLVGDTFQILHENYNNQAGETMYYFLFR